MCAKLLLFISKQHTFSSSAIVRCDQVDKQVIQESCISFQVFIPQINSCAKNASAGFHRGVWGIRSCGMLCSIQCQSATFRNNLSVPYLRVKQFNKIGWFLRLLRSWRRNVGTYRFTLRNMPEDRRFRCRPTYTDMLMCSVFAAVIDKVK